jgi:hypothetical protein
LAAGDLHVGSFGTWRDGLGRLVWGVDDFDEAYPLAYPSDLVRLAVSAMVDASQNRVSVGVRNVCRVILDGYTEGLRSGGRAFVLEERHKWLRDIALDHLDVPAMFWKKMDRLPAVRNRIPQAAQMALRKMLPEPRIPYRVVRRTAGVGSLGHPRYVAIADWCGGQIALEAKAALPSACAWAAHAANPPIYYQKVLDSAVRDPDPGVRLEGKWVVRQLAPDSAPIEIESLAGHREQDRLLHAMAFEVANIHLGTPRAAQAILSDLKSRPGKWFRSAVKDMTKAILTEWKAWKKSVG